MNITIRTERQTDYYEIAEITAQAFTNPYALNEVALIDVLRHRKAFNPDLSLVAVVDEKVVGHVLFSPCDINIGLQYHKCAILAPLAIHPDYQKQGIGGLLIKEGHKRLSELGYQLSILLGHHEYYPKFGYKTHMFGDASIKIATKDVPELDDNSSITERKVEVRDIPYLNELWQTNFSDTDLAIQPGTLLIDWISCGKEMKSVVIEYNQEIIGYMRYKADQPETITSLLLTDNRDSIIQVLSYITKKLEARVELISLPLNGNASLINNNLALPYESQKCVWPAGMIKILDERNVPLTHYCKVVRENESKAGMVTWPIEFEIC